MFIDTHAHLNFRAFKEDFDEVYQNSLDSNVGKIINIGSNYETSLEAVRKIHKGDLYASVGVHPVHLHEDITEVCMINGKEYKVTSKKEIFDYGKYLELGKNEGVVAIGETGLDYFHINNSQNQNDKEKIKNIIQIQKNVFEQHIRLAKELGLPLVLHCRGSEKDPYGAYDEMIEILKNQNSNIKNQNDREKTKNNNTIKGVIHCFVGSKKQAEEFLKMGFYFGVNGIVTFKKSYELQEIVREIPLDKIVLETDCPFLAPDPYRGKRNESKYIPVIGQKIAHLKNIKLKEVEEQTTKDAEKLFKI